MWEYEYSVETTAAPEALWRHWADMAAWPQWNDGIETIDVEGPFEAGTVFIMTQITADFPEVLAALAKRAEG